jgi:serine protease Do
MRRIATIVLVTAVAGFLLVESGAVRIDVHWGPRDAQAIDLFGGGKKEKEKAEEEGPFWTEGGREEGIAPLGVPPTFADLAERVSPGVVNIQTSKTVSGGFNLPRPFEEFFGGNPFFGFENPQREYKVPSLGSGFVISEDGYIVTNNHVVENVDTIQVAFVDGSEEEAEVVGRDPKTDLALIKIDADRKLHALPLGDSDKVRPGEWVVAIGNPFGLEHTVTAGIISAKHRIIGQGSYDDFLQTDAAINPGNSGGPLLNLKGEVIGINTAINPRANTIGFAVPVNMAKSIVPQLRSRGRVVRGWLGVVIQGITPELAEQFELESERGALVSRVLPDGPADDAGLEHGDVIVEFDGKPVADWKDLPRIVADTPVGEKVSLRVVRKGKEKTLRVEIGELEEPELAEAPNKAESEPAALGIRVQDLTDELAQQLGVDEENGVVVTQVEPGGPAAEAGLRRGDVIVEVDRTEVAGVGDLRKKLDEADDDVLMLIRRGDATIFVPVKRRG